jgi:hypothetical protein
VSQSPTQEDIDLAAEAALLERARAALSHGWTDPALSSLDQHRTRYPDGQLLEEREALSVLALARAGRMDEALRHAAAFERQFPGSLWLEQVETVLPRQQ